MDEREFALMADEAFRRIGRGFDDLDPENVDCEVVGDVVTITLQGGKKYVVNTQRPTRQIWFAANAQAWHFSWDGRTRRWVDDKGRGDELFATIARAVREAAGVEVAFG